MQKLLSITLHTNMYVAQRGRWGKGVQLPCPQAPKPCCFVSHKAKRKSHALVCTVYTHNTLRQTDGCFQDKTFNLKTTKIILITLWLPKCSTTKFPTLSFWYYILFFPWKCYECKAVLPAYTSKLHTGKWTGTNFFVMTETVRACVLLAREVRSVSNCKF